MYINTKVLAYEKDIVINCLVIFANIDSFLSRKDTYIYYI